MASKKHVALSLVAVLLLLSGLRSDYLPNLLNTRLTALADQIDSGQGTFGQWTTTGKAPGLVMMSRKYVNSAYGNQVVNVVDVDPTIAKLRTVETQYPNRYETVLSMGNRTKAVAGINGGFFCNTDDDICGPTACTDAQPCLKYKVKGLSLLKAHGELISSNCALRTSFGITESGAPVIQQVGSHKNWPGTVCAIGAGPNLVAGGKKHITQEGFCWYDASAARTAVAILGTHILFVTVDQGYAGADGMKIDDLANFLIDELHVTSAMNFDGGGSTTMYFQGKIVNRPKDQSCGCCRCVYDGLFVYPK